jgi:zinc protease
LRRATVEDVRGFFARHYVPANASVVVAGDVAPSDAITLVKRYFGALETRPPQRLPSQPALPPLDHVVREVLTDNVELPKITMAFRSPARFAPGDAELDLLANVLARGEASLLYRRLVYEQHLAQSVFAAQQSSSLGGAFVVEVVLRANARRDLAERETDHILSSLRTQRISLADLDRARNQVRYSLVERLAPLDSRATMLNLYFALTGRPDFFAADLQRYEQADPDALVRQAQATLTLDRRVILTTVPAHDP